MLENERELGKERWRKGGKGKERDRERVSTLKRARMYQPAPVQAWSCQGFFLSEKGLIVSSSQSKDGRQKASEGSRALWSASH